MKFEYQAIDANGVVIRGIVEASKIEKVLQILLHKQLHPMDIRPLTDTTVELSRLNSLKRRLEGRPIVKQESRPAKTDEEQFDQQFESATSFNPVKEPKESFDWTYIIFLLLIVGLLAAAALG